MLHANVTPSQLYSRVDLDARIEGSSGPELNRICFDALKDALAQAGLAARRSRRREAVASLSRAATVLGGLQRAVDVEAEMGGALVDFYGSISVRLIHAMRDPQEAEIAGLRIDIEDVALALFPPSKAKTR